MKPFLLAIAVTVPLGACAPPAGRFAMVQPAESGLALDTTSGVLCRSTRYFVKVDPALIEQGLPACVELATLRSLAEVQAVFEHGAVLDKLRQKR